MLNYIVEKTVNVKTINTENTTGDETSVNIVNNNLKSIFISLSNIIYSIHIMINIKPDCCRVFVLLKL